ncbi:hypothetical protein RJG79_04635 [Mycoplasmatota bacterium WC44]
MKSCPNCKKKTFSIWKMFDYGSSFKCKECKAIIVYSKKWLFLNYVIFIIIYFPLSGFGGRFVINKLQLSLLVIGFLLLLNISVTTFTPLVKKDK